MSRHNLKVHYTDTGYTQQLEVLKNVYTGPQGHWYFWNISDRLTPLTHQTNIRTYISGDVHA